MEHGSGEQGTAREFGGRARELQRKGSLVKVVSLYGLSWKSVLQSLNKLCVGAGVICHQVRRDPVGGGFKV